MNKLIIGGFALIASLGIGTSAQGAQLFTSELSGENIVPSPISSLGTGVANFSLNDAQTELTYSITISDLALNIDNGTVTKIHFHTGEVDERSPFHVLNIFGPKDDTQAIFTTGTDSFTVSGIWSDADYCFTAASGSYTCDTDPNTTKKLSDYIDALKNNGLYVNIHTTTVASGEIRGQINLVPTPPGQDPIATPEPGSILGLVSLLGLAGLTSRNKKS